ncbi:hypothetical protein A6A19_00380 [Actinobacillus delphinicola]|uniref:type IV secretion system protein n=1 Tax=Actinobacillus delphinicola TaxID=51161 RepID=UPI002441AE2A|nr:type IV secretion system protein [Actinobacillus delphinicola]MDG6896502.1 hypothetical protein [Actinobacillus delphinicola]
MKKIILSGVLIFTISSNTFAGVPVVDYVRVGDQIKTWTVELERWKTKVEQYRQQYTKQLEQYNKQIEDIATKTGARNIAQFMNDSYKMFKDVKDLGKWIQNPENIYKYGTGILSPKLRKIYNQFGLDQLCEIDVPALQKRCEGNIILDAMRQAQAERQIIFLSDHLEKIEKISKRMANAKDIKEAQDLSNSMQAEMALLQAENLKMQISLSSEKLQKEILAKQHEQYFKKILRNESANKTNYF